MNLSGVALFLIGLVGFLKPEKTVRFWFLGTLREGSITDNGLRLYRVIGVLCMGVGIWVAVSF
ncbi:hypothetical protein [Halogeometricum pallidum]|uniref:hypothetical protein n=1 Tax=Halogeometricum pallidum TaxID=411361 RepID=UPI001267AF84|nr:hypothetical protein [Halogeometricum pallidum]